MSPEQTLAFVAKRLPSREVIEQLRSCTLLADDGDKFESVIENLLDIRQAVKGGRRDVRGSRHWPSE